VLNKATVWGTYVWFPYKMKDTEEVEKVHRDELQSKLNVYVVYHMSSDFES